MSNAEHNEVDLVDLHQCSSCGCFSPPERFSSRDNVRGLYECPFCHSSEALNVRVVPRSVVDSQS
jgi:hypothetical protein